MTGDDRKERKKRKEGRAQNGWPRRHGLVVAKSTTGGSLFFLLAGAGAGAVSLAEGLDKPEDNQETKRQEAASPGEEWGRRSQQQSATVGTGEMPEKNGGR